MNTIILQVNPVIDYTVRSLCIKPYYNHPKGCPNFGKKKGCPPDAKLYDKVYDLSEPVFAVCNVFDLKGHIERMRKKHPEWSDRQLRCCLYWQRRARDELLNAIKEFYRKYGLMYKVETCPEAMGVDLIATMKNVGIELVFPPKEVAYQIALAGVRVIDTE